MCIRDSAHAVETAKIASVIAAELGANVEIAKAGALLHDLGKAMDHNIEGTHAQIGAEFAQRYGVNAKVVNICLLYTSYGQPLHCKLTRLTAKFDECVIKR